MTKSRENKSNHGLQRWHRILIPKHKILIPKREETNKTSTGDCHGLLPGESFHATAQDKENTWSTVVSLSWSGRLQNFFKSKRLQFARTPHSSPPLLFPDSVQGSLLPSCLGQRCLKPSLPAASLSPHSQSSSLTSLPPKSK